MNSWRKAGKQLSKDTSQWIRRNKLDPFPIRKELRGYKADELGNDLRSGLNVALLAFPQGMAYAVIAGLPVQFGIYASAIAGILGAIFAGSRFVIFGPTNATAVLIFTAFLSMGVTQAEKLAMLPLLLFMTGGFMILGAFFRVANLIPFISRSVVTGYITAAAFYIIINQLRKVMGIEFEMPQGVTFLGVIQLTVIHLEAVHWPSVGLSALTAFLFFYLNKYFRTLPNVALTLTAVSLIAWLVEKGLGSDPGWQMLAGMERIWPAIALPDFERLWFSEFISLALVLAFLATVEGSFIGKSLAARSGKRIDINQQLFGLGIATWGCSFAGGMGVSGSLTRSQLNWSSGAHSSLSALFSGVFCLLGAFALGPAIGGIPQAALGVLVIAIGLSVINKRVIGVVLRTTRSDAFVFLTTFLVALLTRLDLAIGFGVVLSIVLFLKKAAQPSLLEYGFNPQGELMEVSDSSNTQSTPGISIVHVEGDLFFGAAELFRDQLRRVAENPNLCCVVLKMRNAHHLDATSILALEELIQSMKENDRTLIISEARRDVIRVLRRSGLIDLLGRKHIFVDSPRNPNLSTARALRQAQELLGGEEAQVSIYTPN